MAAAIDRNVWLVQTVTLLFWSFCVSPTGADWCSETVANRSPSNSSECGEVLFMHTKFAGFKNE